MPTKLKNLKRSAKKSCNFRFHKMNNFYQLLNSNIYRANCKCCDMSVAVILDPFPNECEISGDAVACNCPSVPYRQQVKGVIQ